jgi:mono/diheme cytochrome c family protein
MVAPRRLAFAVCALGLVLAACGGKESSGDTASAGEKLFASQNCVTCHKADGSGNAFGPSILQAPEHWTREALAAYFADPEGTVLKDPRLTALSRNYSMKMPPVRGLSDEQRLQIADHVLSLGAKPAK